MSDLIDRYEVIELLKRMRYEADSKWEREMITDTENRINAMPSAEPISQIKWERDTAIAQLKELGYGLGEERKKGKWIPLAMNGEYKCSLCGRASKSDNAAWVNIPSAYWNYCPNCGARMEN